MKVHVMGSTLSRLQFPRISEMLIQKSIFQLLFLTILGVFDIEKLESGVKIQIWDREIHVHDTCTLRKVHVKGQFGILGSKRVFFFIFFSRQIEISTVIISDSLNEYKFPQFRYLSILIMLVFIRMKCIAPFPVYMTIN